MEKYFATNNRIVIYPQQFHDGRVPDEYADFTAEPLHIGIDAVQKLGKSIGSIFKKDDAAGAASEQDPDGPL